MKVSPSDVTAAAATLRAGGWLSRTPADFQDAILSRCTWQHVAPGDVLTYGGDSTGGMYGIARGAVDITPAVGTADIGLIHIARAPYWFGILPVVSDAPRAVTIVPRSACLAAVVPQPALNALLAARPEWWRLMAMQALEHFSLAAQIAADLLIPDSRRRCIAVLLRVAGAGPAGDRSCAADIGQVELAAMANMSRQTTSHILRDLAAAGLIELGYRSIVIRDIGALRALVDI